MKGFAPPAASAAPQAQPPGTGPLQDGVPASDEEQELYNKFVGLAIMHIFDDAARDQIVEQMRGAEDISQTVGAVAANIGFTVIEKAREKGDQVSGDVLMHGGSEIIDTLAAVAGAATGKELSASEIENAYYHGADSLRQMMEAGGHFSPEHAEQTLGEIEQMRGSGELEQLLGGV